MKAISPMIATILLIAFTVAVGGIISVWLSGFTRTATAGTETRAEALTRCSASGFEVVSVKSANKLVYVTHYGTNIAIYPLSVVYSDGTTTSSFDLNTDMKVTTGEVSLINLTSTFPDGATSVKINAFCEYGIINQSIAAECSKGDTCWS